MRQTGQRISKYEQHGIRIRRQWKWHPLVQWAARADWFRRAFGIPVIRGNTIVEPRYGSSESPSGGSQDERKQDDQE